MEITRVDCTFILAAIGLFSLSYTRLTSSCVLHENLELMKERWMDDLRFYFLLTVFQSYQDDVWMIMKGCVQWDSVHG